MKNTHKKVLTLLMLGVLIMALMAGCASGNDTLVVYTSPDFPPYEYMEGKNFVGIDMELAKAIGEKLDREVKIVACDFDGIITAIATKQADMAISGITITELRKESVDFSVPYTNSIQYLILREDSQVATIEDLAGVKVGVARGYTGQYVMEDEIDQYEDDEGNVIDGVLKDTGTELKIYDTAMDASLDLVNNNIDAVVMDALVAQSIASGNSQLKVIPLAYKDSEIPVEEFGVIVPKGDPNNLLDAINNTISELKENGKLDEWATTYAGKEVESE